MMRIRKDSNGLVRWNAAAPMSRRTMMRGAAAATAGAAGLTAAPRWASAETTVEYMGWQGYDVFLEADEFLDKNDLRMDKSWISAPEEIVAKLRLNPGEVDICVPYFLHLDFMAEEGLLAPLDLEKLPNFNNIFPAIIEASRDNMTFKDRWYSAPFTWAAICLNYNTKKIASAPTSWRDMLKPEYKNKCAIAADLPSAFSTWGRIATDAESPNRMTYEQLNKTVEFIIDMKKNHLRTLAASYGELVDLLAREEVVIAQGFEAITFWVGDSAPIGYVYPDEGCMTFVEGWSLSAGSTQPDEVYRLINHSLSVEGQVAGAEYNGMPVTNEKALPKLSEANRSAYPYDDIQSYFNTKLRVDPMYLLEPDGVHATWDDYILAWEKIMKA